MGKKNHVSKRGMGALLAAAMTLGALPNMNVYAMPEQSREPVLAIDAEMAPKEVLTPEGEPAPVYRLVKKGGASKWGYQAMAWIDEDGNEVEGKSFYEEPALYHMKDALPSSYSMADQKELPAVRNQGQWGTCWAHAAIASVETNMVKKGLIEASDADYSERHLSYFAHRRNEALGDGEDSPSEDYGWYGGGNYYQALAVLSNWNGAADEKDYPYASYGDMDDLAESDRMASVSHVTDADFLNTAEDVKRAVMDTGAVMCSFYTGDGTVNSAQEFVYHANEHDIDHSVNIVGWDDDYDKTVFDDNGQQPENNGAWLCRNSWGADWAQGGYFWISYEDATLGEFCSFQAEGADNYDHIYSYDGAMTLASISYGKSANIFQASEAEELKAVSFSSDKNYDYLIEIYADRDGTMEVPSDGILVCSQEGSLSYPGYHTVSLENGVTLDAGMKYAVSVQFIPKNEEEMANTYLETTEWGGNYSSDPGQSFFYIGSQWRTTEDLNAGFKNICVKAFTSDAESVDEARILSLIAEAESLEGSDYTVKSWEAMQAAITGARQAVSENTNSGKIRALLDLQSAKLSLTPANVFISTEAELESFSASVASGNTYEGQTVHLLNDLDMTGITHTMIGNGSAPFQGTFDGGGHEIANLTYEFNYSYGGLFGHVGENGTVKNVRLTDAVMTFGHIYSGGIAGFNKGTVSGCAIQGNLTFEHGYSGGIAGVNDGTVSACGIMGNIQMNYNSGQIGGAIGDNRGTMENVMVNGTVTFQNQQENGCFVGGIAGENSGIIAKCSMEGEIIADSNASVGGIVGFSKAGSAVRLCRNLASISGNPASDTRTAGIGVCLYGETHGCYNYGEIQRSAGNETGAVYCYLNEASSFSNCYYLDTSCARGGYYPAFSDAGMTESDFASGKVAYYLNSNGKTAENTYEWSQENGLPVYADDGHKAIVKASVRQAEDSACRILVNGMAEGEFYTSGGSLAEIAFENAEPPLGYKLSTEITGLLPSGQDNVFVLPDNDTEIIVRGRIKLANGNYEVEDVNGYVGETAVIRPVLPASKIKLASDAAFTGSLAVDTDGEVSIITCDDEGTCSDAETVSFQKDTEAPVIESVQVLETGGEGYLKRTYIEVAASDEKSGVSAYSFDGGDTWQERERLYVTCKKEESVFDGRILVRDGLGNTAEYTGQITIPAAGKYASWIRLSVEETSYTYGESFVLSADITYEDAGEDAKICGQVRFLTADGDEIGTSDVTESNTEAGSGMAQITVHPSMYGNIGEKKFIAVYDGEETPYQSSESDECAVQIENVLIPAPVFEEIEVEMGTSSAAGAKELGENALPTRGRVFAGGGFIAYEITWDEGQTINLTAAGSCQEFVGTITYLNVPEWAKEPESHEIKRKVTVKQPKENPPKDPGSHDPSKDDAPKFQKGATAVSKNGRYQVIDAKKKTAALVEAVNKNVKKFEVPDTVKICGTTCKVVEIKANALKGKSNLKNLILGKNVVKIGKQAFMNCKKLSSIRIKGKAIKTVGPKAFKKTAAKIVVTAKKMTKKQKSVLLRKLKTAGISKKVKI